MQPRISFADQSKGTPSTRPRRVILNDGMKALGPLSVRRGLQRNALAIVLIRKDRAKQFLPIFFTLPLTMSLTFLTGFYQKTPGGAHCQQKGKLRSSGNE
ncbi:hypothetical protein EVAR_68743_1 [Eumeta japonica]|uniref:Uncharacterized protein n=1 Tax=Eumeta variegata TaxID=151549 RepID=A0A4C1ZLS3_EUMVA|nr:hypothetical protein EVAR_68743_1 [Eumeta japonica]